MSLATSISLCTSREGTIKKVSETGNSILVMYKGSQWESGYKIVWVSNFIGKDASVDTKVPMPKKFSTIQLTQNDEKAPNFGEPIVTKDGIPVMKLDNIIEE